MRGERRDRLGDGPARGLRRLLRLRLARGWRLALLALALAALASSLYFHRLGAAPLFGDEAIHAVVARESAERDGWLPPTLDGRLYLAKPPLKILAVAWIFDRFGESELHARVLDAGFGVATVVVVFLLGCRLWGAWEGLLAALLLATAESYVFRHGVREGVQDSALVFFVTAGLALYGLRHRREGRQWPLVAGSGLALGLGVLVKGPVAGLALPVLLAWELVDGRRGDRSRKEGLLDLSVVAGMALACYLVWLGAAYSWSDGRVFRFMYTDVWVRVSESLHPSHRHGPAFYPLRLVRDFGPWLLAALPALLALRPRSGLARPEARQDRGGLLLVLFWAAVMLGLLSLSRSKLPWYLYPAYPGFALLLARGTTEVVRGTARLRVVAAALLVLITFGMWQRIDRVRTRVEAEPPVVYAERYARAIAGLPRAVLFIDRRLELRTWELWYLGPLARRGRELPPEVLVPSEGLCRFLLRAHPGAPDAVEARRPVSALALQTEDRERRHWLQDLDHCLPTWL